MTYQQISCMHPINEVDEDKVQALMDSMRKNGFVGCPILVYGDEILTGSHRLVALQRLAETDLCVDDWDVAEDVTDIVEDNYSRFVDDNGWAPDIDYSNIGWLLEGSWVEEYKDEIAEW